MSAENIIKQIAVVDREIHAIEKRIQVIDGNIIRKSKDVHNLLTKISREKDLKRLLTYQRDLNRKNEEIAKLEKDKSSKSQLLATKQKKKYDLQNKLNNEEKKERDKTKKEQGDLLTLQQQLTREMEKQRAQSLRSFDILKPKAMEQTTYDVFVSHASEDKEDFVREFVECLQSNGLKVWYDEFTMRLGDSLRRSIDHGLKSSRFGIVVLSEAFFSKEWPQRELDGLFAREVSGEKVILPIWHKITKNQVMSYSPIIGDMLALNTSSFTIQEIAKQVSDRVGSQ